MQERIGSYLALGDSFTEGMEDVRGPDGRHRGWADRLAAGLAAGEPGLAYANLAIRGRLLDQVVEEQVPVALTWRPDLVSFHAGANDVLRPKADVDAVAARYDAAVASLGDAGLRVLLCTVIERAGGRYVVPWLGRRLRGVSSGDGVVPKRPELTPVPGI